jgi:transcriptional regulator with GAF, ATPase, and Fis domain
VFPIVVPPLRDRKEDIPALVHYFIDRKSRELGLRRPPTFTPEAMSRLMSYYWPGNVRELANLVEREIILRREGPLVFSNMEAPSTCYPTSSEKVNITKLTYNQHLVHIISEALQATEGKINGRGGAAALLGVNPSTLRNRMKKLGIPFKKQAELGYMYGKNSML